MSPKEPDHLKEWNAWCKGCKHTSDTVSQCNIYDTCANTHIIQFYSTNAIKTVESYMKPMLIIASSFPRFCSDIQQIFFGTTLPERSGDVRLQKANKQRALIFQRVATFPSFLKQIVSTEGLNRLFWGHGRFHLKLQETCSFHPVVIACLNSFTVLSCDQKSETFHTC